MITGVVDLAHLALNQAAKPPSSYNHGSGKWVYLKYLFLSFRVIVHFYTSMIMGEKVDP